MALFRGLLLAALLLNTTLPQWAWCGSVRHAASSAGLSGWSALIGCCDRGAPCSCTCCCPEEEACCALRDAALGRAGAGVPAVAAACPCGCVHRAPDGHGHAPPLPPPPRHGGAEMLPLTVAARGVEREIDPPAHAERTRPGGVGQGIRPVCEVRLSRLCVLRT